MNRTSFSGFFFNYLWIELILGFCWNYIIISAVWSFLSFRFLFFCLLIIVSLIPCDFIGSLISVFTAGFSNEDVSVWLLRAFIHDLTVSMLSCSLIVLVELWFLNNVHRVGWLLMISCYRSSCEFFVSICPPVSLCLLSPGWVFLDRYLITPLCINKAVFHLWLKCLLCFLRLILTCSTGAFPSSPVLLWIFVDTLGFLFLFMHLIKH